MFIRLQTASGRLHTDQLNPTIIQEGMENPHGIGTAAHTGHDIIEAGLGFHDLPLGFVRLWTGNLAPSSDTGGDRRPSPEGSRCYPHW